MHRLTKRKTIVVLAAALTVLIGSGIALACGSYVEIRRVRHWRPAAISLEHLELSEGWQFGDGPRSLQDRFPYLVAAKNPAKENVNARVIESHSLSTVLRKTKLEDGRVAAIPSADAALEAVRLFVAGPLVKDQATAERIIEEARVLKYDFLHLAPSVTDYRPESYEPTVTARKDSAQPQSAWDVSLVALELDRRLRLVHVTATVYMGGYMMIERRPIVDGPLTSSQTAGPRTLASRRRQAAMSAEAEFALATFWTAI